MNALEHVSLGHSCFHDVIGGMGVVNDLSNLFDL
jgi:hypothetical protein